MQNEKLDKINTINDIEKKLSNESKNTNKVSGIYILLNKINNKWYVGSSNNILLRWITHKRSLRKNNHINKHLQRAWNKYGEESFEFHIIELINSCDLLVVEQKYLDYAKTHKIKYYNINFVSTGFGSGNLHPSFITLNKNTYNKAKQIWIDFGKGKLIEFLQSLSIGKGLRKRLIDEFQQDKNAYNTRKKNREIERQMVCAKNMKPRYGIKNNKTDLTIYTFYNSLLNERFSGTQVEFSNKIKSSNNVSVLVLGKRKSVKGWTMNPNIKAGHLSGGENSKSNKTIYSFYNTLTGESFKGFVSDFYRIHNINASSAHRLLYKQRKQCNGWILINP